MPPKPWLPACWYLPFHIVVGSHTSIPIAEPGTGRLGHVRTAQRPCRYERDTGPGLDCAYLVSLHLSSPWAVRGERASATVSARRIILRDVPMLGNGLSS